MGIRPPPPPSEVVCVSGFRVLAAAGQAPACHQHSEDSARGPDVTGLLQPSSSSTDDEDVVEGMGGVPAAAVSSNAKITSR